MMPPPRRIVISGASRGLGAALAEAFAAPTVTLGLIARSTDGLAETAVRCRAKGAAVETAALDIRDGAAIAAFLHRFDAAAPVDCVIANAGIAAGRDPQGNWEGAAQATAQIAVNLLGAMHLIEPLLDPLRRRRSGRIALIASLAGLRGLPDAPAYSASKAGLRSYGEALRAALRREGVAVTVVLPGFFDSAMGRRWLGPRPLALPLTAAAARIHRAILRGAPRCTFPLSLALLLRLCDVLPAGLSDRAIRCFRFCIRPPA